MARIRDSLVWQVKEKMTFSEPACFRLLYQVKAEWNDALFGKGEGRRVSLKPRFFLLLGFIFDLCRVCLLLQSQ